MHILIVDDSEEAREITEAALFTAGYRDIITAASAAEAFRLLQLHNAPAPALPIDLILLDIMMPEIDGIEACARIRSDPRYGDVPIIMVTARGDMDSLANAFVAGATDYITKPVNRIELLARARAALRLKAELDRRQARERELLDFLASWGDRRATLWIDEATGLLVGEIAEAYLTAATDAEATEASLIALSIDRLPVLHAARGSEAVRGVLHQVAAAIKATPACIGTLAASYRNGLIVLVLPGVGLDRAQALAATLREAIAALQLANAEAIAADHVTVSIAAMTARIRSGADRVKLLTQTISAAQDAARSGGDRVVAASL